MIKIYRSGFSLPEMMIALGLTAAVALGGVYLLKNVESDKKKINVQNDAHNLHKLIQAQLLTDKGCSSIKGKSPGSDLQIEGSSGQFHGAGKIIGNVKIDSFKFASFRETTPGSPNGLAEVEVSLVGKDSDPSSPKVSDQRKIMMAVNMKNGVVEDCKLNYSKAYAEMMDRICEKTWGPLTAGMTCPQAIAAVEAKIIEEICRDVYGEGNFVITDGQCNLKMIHANKSCPQPRGISGFTSTSRVTCQGVSLGVSASPPPTTPSAPQDPPAPQEPTCASNQGQSCSAMKWISGPVDCDAIRAQFGDIACAEQSSSQGYMGQVPGTIDCTGSCIAN